jgi:hypothetical protein
VVEIAAPVRGARRYSDVSLLQRDDSLVREPWPRQ